MCAILPKTWKLKRKQNGRTCIQGVDFMKNESYNQEKGKGHVYICMVEKEKQHTKMYIIY